MSTTEIAQHLANIADELWTAGEEAHATAVEAVLVGYCLEKNIMPPDSA